MTGAAPGNLVGVSGAEPILVSTYGFNVPCRRFLVSANVTRDRRLPIVDEFVLRLLKLCEEVPVRRLAGFLGFSSAEMSVVLTDLIGRGLIVVSAEAATLHSSAHEMFRGVVDGTPRLMEIEPWVERIWFDLISRNMLVPERARQVRNLITLPSDNLAKDLPADFARQAFEQNFAEYLVKVRRIRNPDHFGLYSVAEVEADRFGFAVVVGREELELSPPRTVRRILDGDVADMAKFRPLTAVMSDALGNLDQPEASAAAVRDFQRLTGDTSVARFHGDDGHFRLLDWYSSHGAATDRVPLIGAPSLQRNVGALLRTLPPRGQDRAVSQQKAELLWFRPGGGLWGASLDVQAMLNQLKVSLNQAMPQSSSMSCTLVTPPSASKDAPSRFGSIFDAGWVTPSGYLSGGVEVVLLRGVCAAVSVRVLVAPKVSVDVGFATGSQEVLGRIEKALKWNETSSDTDPLWRRRDRASEVALPEAIDIED